MIPEPPHDAALSATLPGYQAAALVFSANVHIHAGQFAAASALIEAADAIDDGSTNAPNTYAWLVIAAWRGQEARALELIEVSIGEAAARGEGATVGLVEYARAVLYNGQGCYPGAFAAARRACESDDSSWFSWALTELVEASVRCGRLGAARAAMRELEERTCVAGTGWARGIEARSRALLGNGENTEMLYRESLDRLAGDGVALHRARAHLVFGEWLRRENRRVDAREQLRVAHRMLTDMGAHGFAGRAERELLATGETVRKRTVETREELTAQEAQIAGLASDGRTNSEIGTELFISPRTVEWHLRKVFTKLGISSRRQLRAALAVLARTAHERVTVAMSMSTE